MEKKFKVLVTEHVGEAGLDLLRQAQDVELDIKIGLSLPELLAILPEYDGILTRSGTTMDAEKIDAGKNLKVIGRAGVGVDNIDLAEASRRGIIVINAPSGNTFAAAELTMANMLSVIRHIPQAFETIKKGIWERAKFTGMQLLNKTVLIIGLGRIGSEIAKRCHGFGMKVIAYDPYITNQKAESLSVDLYDDLEKALAQADIVTIHTPLTEETSQMINAELLSHFKDGACLINCARGGIVDELAICEALRSKKLSCFATDVYPKEPLKLDHPYLAEDLADRIVLTPHIGANTFEAQDEVARIAAQNMLAVLRGEEYEHAVNLPFIEQSLTSTQKKYLSISRKLGLLVARMARLNNSSIHSCHVTLRGSLFNTELKLMAGVYRPYTVAALKGVLEASGNEGVSYMMAPLIAADRHVDIVETTGDPKTYKNTISVSVDTPKGPVCATATITEEGRQRIVQVNDYWIDFVPQGKILLFQNHDTPGVIGKIGSILGNANVNIANFALGRKDGGTALGAISFDGDIEPQTRKRLLEDTGLIWATTVNFD
ncbi:MAG: phosphoglycerate dehydrogenase [Synergistaceae bacterium]|nr:phosphoglycerate dehydrogenase [Synergistaceae bacterium]